MCRFGGLGEQQLEEIIEWHFFKIHGEFSISRRISHFEVIKFEPMLYFIMYSISPILVILKCSLIPMPKGNTIDVIQRIINCAEEILSSLFLLPHYSLKSFRVKFTQFYRLNSAIMNI